MPSFGPIKRRDFIHYLRRAASKVRSKADDIKPCAADHSPFRFRIHTKATSESSSSKRSCDRLKLRGTIGNDFDLICYLIFKEQSPTVSHPRLQTQRVFYRRAAHGVVLEAGLAHDVAMQAVAAVEDDRLVH